MSLAVDVELSEFVYIVEDPGLSEVLSVAGSMFQAVDPLHVGSLPSGIPVEVLVIKLSVFVAPGTCVYEVVTMLLDV